MKKRSISELASRYLPWLVVVLIFGYLFSRIDLYDFVASFGRVSWWFFLMSSIYVFAFFFMDVFIFTLMFRAFGTEVVYREMLPARGSTYMLMILHFMAGAGGFALVMNRWKKLSIARATGVVFWSMYIDYYSLLLFCVSGAFRLEDVDIVNFFSGSEAGDLVRFVTISWFVFFAVLAFFRVVLPRSGRFEGLKANNFALPFIESPFSRYVKFIALKMPQYLTGIVTTYFAMRAFGLHAPILNLAVMLPLVWLISSIPITPLRLGTTQAAMVWLVARYVTAEGMSVGEIEAAVFACSVLWEMSLLIVRFVIGSFCIKWMPEEVWKAARGGEESPGPDPA